MPSAFRLGWVALSLWLGLTAAAGAQEPLAPAPPSPAVRQFSAWVVASGDNRRMPFLVVDKQAATIFVFSADGERRGSSPVLLGAAVGDDSAPGVGARKLSAITLPERTTPAGRFVSSLGADLGKQDVVWVDYAAAISLHRVVTANPKEHRLQRLASVTPLDNRISYGCINAPAAFYDAVIRPAFIGTDAIVYVLPEVRTMDEVFPGFWTAGARAAASRTSFPQPLSPR